MDYKCIFYDKVYNVLGMVVKIVNEFINDECIVFFNEK